MGKRSVFHVIANLGLLLAVLATSGQLSGLAIALGPSCN